MLTQLRLTHAPRPKHPRVTKQASLPGWPCESPGEIKGQYNIPVPHEQFCRVQGVPGNHRSELGAGVLAKQGGESKGGTDPLCYLHTPTGEGGSTALCVAQSPPGLSFRVNLGPSPFFSCLHAPDHDGDERLGCQVRFRNSRHSEMQNRDWQGRLQSRNQMHEPGLQ